jgi:predicted permease
MMEWFSILMARLRVLFRRESILRDIEEELRAHIEMETEANIKRGAPPDEARAAALKSFGNVSRNTERGYDIRGGGWLETLWQDMRYGARMLWKNPGFTLVAILTLALGIGANTAIFTLVNAVFLQPLPVAEPSRLMSVFGTDEKNRGAQTDYISMSWPNFKDYRDQNDVFTEMIAFQNIVLNFSGGGEPEKIGGMIVTGNYFDLLGVKAAIGRTFLPEEDRTPGTHPVVVLSYGAWQRRFGGDPAIVGRSIKLNGLDYTVVGVAVEGFKGTNAIGGGPDCWAPMMMHDQVLIKLFRDTFNARRAMIFNVIGRLKPGVTEQQAETAMRAIGRRLEQDYPNYNDKRNVTLVPLNQSAIPPQERSAYLRASGLMLTVVGLVLLIACANVASLLLARATARRKEIALRMALGAGRARLIRQLMTESLMLALAGCGAGLLLARAGRDLLWAFRPPGMNAGYINLSFDPRVLGYTLLLSLLTGVIFGLAPALQASRAELVTELNEKGGQAAGGRRWFSLRNLLVAGQVAFSLVALISAGLFLRSLSNARRINPGFETEKLLALTFDVDAQGYDKARGMEHYRRVVERVEAIPGVISAAIASNRPLGGGFTRSVFVEGQEPSRGERGIFTTVGAVGPKYFETMGISLVRGRNFTEADRENTPPVVVINEAMANRFWPNQDAVGKRFRFFGGVSQEVVGIVKNSAVQDIDEDPRPVAYLSLLQDYQPWVTLHVRTAGDPSGLLATVRREAQALDRTMPLLNPATISESIGEQLWGARMGAALLAVFGLLALILTSVGIYGVVAFSVSQRTSEFGIRLALGARPSDVLRLALGQILTLVAAGAMIGITGGLIVTRMVRNLLYGVSAVDLATFIGMPLLLLMVALMASYLPARRATKIDPMIALRQE